MARQLLATVAAVLVAAPLHAVQPVRTMYNDAVAKEQIAREALADPTAAPDAALKSVRVAIAWYEAVVRRYPLSGYSDNALWQAGRLALEAYRRFGHEQDKAAGLRLLRALESEYPTSKLARQVADQLTAPPGGPKGPALQTKGPPLQAISKPATITEIRRVSLPDLVRVTIALDVEGPFHDERIPGPARIFVDFPATKAAPALVDQTLRFDADDDVVRQVRIGRHPNSVTRVVLDATGVSSYSVYPLYNPYRLVIDCIRESTPRSKPAIVVAMAAPPARPIEPPARPLASRRLTNDWGRRLPSFSPRATALLRAVALPAAVTPPLSARMLAGDWGRSLPAPAAAATATIADAFAPVPEPEAAVHAALPPPSATIPTDALPGSGLGPGFSMARQLGLGISRIVIDPGHGGHDPGAKGKGVTEAGLVLDVSLRLQKLLQRVRGVEVILTRRTDAYVPLQERTAIANREGADLFLSIHANASPNEQAHGIETYFLNFANNLSAAAVAARENAVSGQTMGALPDFVKAIALTNKLDESKDFATLVQASMVERLRGANKAVKNLGVKQAPFVVLIGASMPSVLAEISFLTHAQEAKLLKSGAYRQKIAEALFNAIRQYQTSLRTVKTVALQ